MERRLGEITDNSQESGLNLKNVFRSFETLMNYLKSNSLDKEFNSFVKQKGMNQPIPEDCKDNNGIQTSYFVKFHPHEKDLLLMMD